MVQGTAVAAAVVNCGNALHSTPRGRRPPLCDPRVALLAHPLGGQGPDQDRRLGARRDTRGARGAFEFALRGHPRLPGTSLRVRAGTIGDDVDHGADLLGGKPVSQARCHAAPGAGARRDMRAASFAVSWTRQPAAGAVVRVPAAYAARDVRLQPVYGRRAARSAHDAPGTPAS